MQWLEKAVQDLTESVKSYVSKSMLACEEKIAALEKRIHEIPAGPKGDAGESGKDGLNGKDGADGKDADPELIKSEIKKALAEIPQPNIAELTTKSFEEFANYICQGLNEA